MNKDFTSRPTAEAALTAICSRLSESNRNIPGLIVQWPAQIFSDNKSNPVVNEHCVIANRGIVFARDIVERGVVVSKRRHGLVDNWGGVVGTLGIGVPNGVAISLIYYHCPPNVALLLPLSQSVRQAAQGCRWVACHHLQAAWCRRLSTVLSSSCYCHQQQCDNKMIFCGCWMGKNRRGKKYLLGGNYEWPGDLSPVVKRNHWWIIAGDASSWRTG